MAFSGTGHRLGNGEWDTAEPGTTLAHSVGAVPTLKDICLSTLDRYIDMLEDIGSTPYYLIEGVLRKCNIKQLTRVELHTEGLEEYTDELWYIHAKNDFKAIREGWPHYDESGIWRSKYQALKQEDEDKLERKRAQLRQSYSQHDKFKQDRRVIMDPNLRLPKKIRTPSSSSSWSSNVPKKKSLFEKARLEARKITQMYNTNPYPPPRSRIDSSSSASAHKKTPSGRLTAFGSGASSVGKGPTSNHILAPTHVFAHNRAHIALGSTASRNDLALAAHGTVVNGLSSPARSPTSTISSGKRYSYKTRPVVYTPLSRSLPAHGSEDSVSPTSTRAPAGHKLITPSASGAIVNFFKEINPGHSHATASYRNQVDSISESPPSPPYPPSKTIQMLREDAGTAVRFNRPNDQPSKKHGDHSRREHGKLMVDTKNKNDFRWLEEDDNDDDINSREKTEKVSPKKAANKTPLSLEEAGRQFFNQANDVVGHPPAMDILYQRGYLLDGPSSIVATSLLKSDLVAPKAKDSCP